MASARGLSFRLLFLATFSGLCALSAGKGLDSDNINSASAQDAKYAPKNSEMEVTEVKSSLNDTSTSYVRTEGFKGSVSQLDIFAEEGQTVVLTVTEWGLISISDCFEMYMDGEPDRTYRGRGPFPPDVHGCGNDKKLATHGPWVSTGRHFSVRLLVRSESTVPPNVRVSFTSSESVRNEQLHWTYVWLSDEEADELAAEASAGVARLSPPGGFIGLPALVLGAFLSRAFSYIS